MTATPEQHAAAVDRAVRIASNAAEELIRAEGVPTPYPDEFALAPDQIDERMQECIDHLRWHGLAVQVECDEGTVVVQLGDFTLEGLV